MPVPRVPDTMQHDLNALHCGGIGGYVIKLETLITKGADVTSPANAGGGC